HVAARVPPEPDGSEATAGALARRYARPLPGMVADLDDMADKLAELRDVAAQQAALKARRAELSNAVKAALGAAEEGTVGGQLAVTWRESRPRRVNVERMREDHPALVEQYTEQGSQRTLLIKGEADA
ncbi:MAG: hypothetical protein J2P30_15675, partial [Actinobacteria bacterium]|nr:hypothetical protein [Actinomycetota bacterium]